MSNGKGKIKLIDKASIRVDIFSHSLNRILENNLVTYLLSTVSNMLALNYASDKDLQKIQPNAANYADICARRIKRFLGEKVLLEESFDTALQVFMISLSDSYTNSEDLPQMSKAQEQDKIINIIAETTFGEDISPDEMSLLEDVIDSSLGRADAADIMKLIGKEPDILKALIRAKKCSAIEITNELSNTALSYSKSNSNISNLMQIAGLTICSAMAFGANLLIVQSFQAVAAAAIIPISIVALKYGADLGEKIGSKIANLDKGFQRIKSDMLNKVPGINQEYQVDQEIQIHEVGIAKAQAQNISKDIEAHIDRTSTKEQIEEVQRSLQKTAERSNEKALTKSHGL